MYLHDRHKTAKGNVTVGLSVCLFTSLKFTPLVFLSFLFLAFPFNFFSSFSSVIAVGKSGERRRRRRSGGERRRGRGSWKWVREGKGKRWCKFGREWKQREVGVVRLEGRERKG